MAKRDSIQRGCTYAASMGAQPAKTPKDEEDALGEQLSGS